MSFAVLTDMVWPGPANQRTIRVRMLGLNSWILLEGEFYGYMIRGGLVGVLVCFSILVFSVFF